MMSEMQDEQTAGDTPAATEANNGRERSTIKFPYGDLDSAVELALAVSRYGLDCSTGQLAAALAMHAGAPGYRARISTALIFGLIESAKGGTVSLTPLGRRLVDPMQVDAAKADAFLSVPLYAHIFELFDGTVLPDDPALEAVMVKAGVAAKVARKARQAFARSAEQAGFFAAGRTRLVRPSGATVQTASSRPDAPVEAEVPAAEPSEVVLSNALLAALFKKMLPEEGEEFSAKERRRLFRALAVNLDVIYGEPADGELDNDKVAEIFKITREDPGRGASVAHIAPS